MKNIYILFFFAYLFFPCSTLFAQSNPGGVSGSTYWYKVHELNLANGASITTMTDYSGNGIDLTQSAIAGNFPIYNTTSLNGLATATFNDSRMVSTVSSFPTTAITSFIILNANAASDGIISYDANDGSATNNDYLIFNPGSLTPYVNSNTWVQGSDITGNWTILSHTWDDANGSFIHLNGTAFSDNTHGNGATIDYNVGAVLAVGGEQDGPDGDTSGGSQEYDGELAEVIVFPKALNIAERKIIENYLSARYNLAITNDLYVGDNVGNGDYDFGVIGIGQEAGVDHINASSDGLILTENGTTLEDGDYVLAGFNQVTNSEETTDIAGVAGLEARWSRVWYFDRTDANNSSRVDITFDGTDSGIGVINMSSANNTDYKLLYRAGTAGTWTEVASATSFNNLSNSVTFSNVDLSANGDGFYTLGTVDNTNSPVSGIPPTTYYSYQNGDWQNSLNWTLDPSGTTYTAGPGLGYPVGGDEAVILNGVTIVANAVANGLDGAAAGVNPFSAVEVQGGGVLDFAGTIDHDIDILRGDGRLRFSGSGGNLNFPTVTTPTEFQNGDGEVELYGAANITLNTSYTFPSLVINMNATGIQVDLEIDYTLNQNLEVRRGTFRFADAANFTLEVFEDIRIEANGRIETETGGANRRHELNLHGDFLNLGYAQFSDRTAQTTTAESGDVKVDFNLVSTNRNQDINCNGETYFYRIEVTKGNPVYVAAIQASAGANFVLTGAANYASNLDVSVPADNQNAVGLITGTLKLGNNVDVGDLSNTSVYGIGSNARLWIDGGRAVKTAGAAIVPYGILEVSAGLLESYPQSGITTRGTGSLIVSGSGVVNTTQFRTSIGGAGNQGGYIQRGGSMNVGGSFLGGAGTPANPYAGYSLFNLTYEGNVFIMEGGTLNLRDAPTCAGNCGVGDKGGLIFINSDPGNISVTGGTVNVDVNNAQFARISSRAPFYNLNILNSTTSTSANARVIVGSGLAGPGGADDRTITNPDLIVLNDLTIQSGVTRSQTIGGRNNEWGSYLDLCPSNNCVNLEVGGDLTIQDSGVLDVWAWDGTDNDGSATVTMNGTTNATLYVGDIATYTNDLVEYRSPDNGPWPTGFDGQDETYGIYTLPFYNWYIDKPGATISLSAKLPSKGEGAPGTNRSNYKTSNGGKNLSRYAVRLIQVSNDFQLLNGTLSQIDPTNTLALVEGDGTDFGVVGDQVVYGMYLQGSITINGQCFVYTPGSTRKEGTVNLRTENDVIINSIAGAAIGNLEVNNAEYTVSLTSDLVVGRLQYAAGVIDIGTHNFRLDEFEFLELSSSNFIPNVGGQGIYGVYSSTATEKNYIRMAGNASDGGLSIRMPRSLTTYSSSPPSFPDAVYTQVYNIVDRAQYYQDGVVYNNTDRIWFPVGTNANALERYTPAVMQIVDDSGVTYSGDEYVTVRVVDSKLATTNQDVSGGNPDAILSYYWRVTKEGFDAGDPSVSWIFQYDDADVSVNLNGQSSTEASLVPGKVEDGGTYQRSYDGTAQSVKEGGAANDDANLLGANPANVILFNGDNTANTVDANGAPDTIGDIAGDEIATGTGSSLYTYGNTTISANWSTAFPGSGLTLENANYTAGVPERFTGSPQVYYTRASSSVGFLGIVGWNDGNTWTRDDLPGFDPTSPHRTDNPAAGDFPQAGDVAVIGFIPYDDPIVAERGDPQIANAGNGTVYCAELVFTQLTDALGNTPAPANTDRFFAERPTLMFQGLTGDISTSQIRGEGFIFASQADPNFAAIDMGGFVNEDLSTIFYERRVGNPVDLLNVPSIVPNLILGGDAFGRNGFDVTLAKDITVNGDLKLFGNVNVLLEEGAVGDIIVNGNLDMYELSTPTFGDSGGGAAFLYPNSVGSTRSVTIFGDVLMNNQSGLIAIDGAPTANGLVHSLTVHGSIEQNTGIGADVTDLNTELGLQLWNGVGNDRIDLFLLGKGTIIIQESQEQLRL